MTPTAPPPTDRLAPAGAVGVPNPDPAPLCVWVTETGELPLISGETQHTLTPQILQEWLDRAQAIEFEAHPRAGAGTTESFASAEALDRLRPVGLAMLSSREAELPADAIELVHLIVRPEYRRRGRATRMVQALHDHARRLGKRRLLGRIVPTNAPPRRLFEKLGFRELAPGELGLSPAFVWVERLLGEVPHGDLR